MSSKKSILSAPVKKKHLKDSFQFAVDFHLSPNKPKMNRTTGQTRGLGGVSDSFLLGKVTELAVVDILKKFNRKKECILDLQVHDVSDKDPDIVKVKEKKSERDPKVFVEIKNIGDADRWIGLTEEQFKTIQKNTIVGKNLKKIYIVYAVLKNTKQENSRKDDLLGVFLKSKIKSDQFKKFSKLSHMSIEIKSVLTAADLKSKGTRFEKGYYFYETEIFRTADESVKNLKNVKKIKTKNNRLPEFKMAKPVKGKKIPPFPKRFSPIKYSGKIVLYKKNNEKSTRMYIQCLSNVKVSCNIIGEFNLKKGHFYEYYPATVGRNPQLNRNNIWIAKRNMNKIITKSPKKMLKEIAKSI